MPDHNNSILVGSNRNKCLVLVPFDQSSVTVNEKHISSSPSLQDIASFLSTRCSFETVDRRSKMQRSRQSRRLMSAPITDRAAQWLQTDKAGKLISDVLIDRSRCKIGTQLAKGHESLKGRADQMSLDEKKRCSQRRTCTDEHMHTSLCVLSFNWWED